MLKRISLNMYFALLKVVDHGLTIKKTIVEKQNRLVLKKNLFCYMVIGIMKCTLNVKSMFVKIYSKILYVSFEKKWPNNLKPM